MRLTLAEKIYLGFTAALVMLALVAGLTWMSVRRLRQDQRLVAHTRGVQAELVRLWNLLLAAELAQSRYLLADDDSQLRSYGQYIAEIPKSLARLRAETRGHSRHQRRLDILAPALAARIAFLDQTGETFRAQGLEAVRRAAATGEARAQGQRIAQAIRLMGEEERGALVELERQATFSARLTASTAIGGFAITVLLLGCAGYFIRREMLEKASMERGERQARQLLDAVLEGSGAAIYAKDLEDRFLMMNHQCAAIIGVEPAAGVGRTTAELLPGVDTTAYRRNDQAVMETGRPLEFEETLQRDGRLRTFLSVKYPLRDRSGAVSGVCGISTDITTRKDAERALGEAKEAAEQASRFKDRFLSTMSHELRTPLNAVIGFSELLGDPRYGALNDRQRRYIDNIHTAGQHLLRIINDILDLSKIEAGRLDLAIEQVRVDQAIRDVVGALKPLADKKSQIIESRCPSGLAVRADATRLRQVLLNLAGNAIKFTPERGRIVLEAQPVDGQARITVRDTGPGIPAKDQRLIFDSFYRAPNATRKEGTGLGLAIACRLLELHGSRLELFSQDGQGTAFWFRLPQTRVPEAPPAPVCDPGAKGTVLVVEDDPTSAQIIEAHLASDGYGTVRCCEPQQALAMAEQVRPVAITLDILMKPISGWEVLAQIKQSSSTREIPVVLVTVVDHKPAGALLGAEEYLVKPVQKDVLLAAIRRALRRQRVSGEPSILVVDDDPASRETIATVLNNCGYRVHTAESAETAQQHLQNGLPALVILDLVLPSGSGFDLLARWREEPRTAGLPVLVLTGKELSSEEQEQIRRQAQGLVRKTADWQKPLVEVLNQTMSAQTGRA